MRSSPRGAAVLAEARQLAARMHAPAIAGAFNPPPAFRLAGSADTALLRRNSSPMPAAPSTTPRGSVRSREIVKSVPGRVDPIWAICAAAPKSAAAGSARRLGRRASPVGMISAISPARSASSAAAVAGAISGAISSVSGIDQSATLPKRAMTSPRVAACAAMLTAMSSARRVHILCSGAGNREPIRSAAANQVALFARRPAVASAERRNPASYAIAGSKMRRATTVCERATAPAPLRPLVSASSAAALMTLARMTLALAPAKRP